MYRSRLGRPGDRCLRAFLCAYRICLLLRRVGDARGDGAEGSRSGEEGEAQADHGHRDVESPHDRLDPDIESFESGIDSLEPRVDVAQRPVNGPQLRVSVVFGEDALGELVPKARALPSACGASNPASLRRLRIPTCRSPSRVLLLFVG